jgi:predicted component of type VI protein secretion system
MSVPKKKRMLVASKQPAAFMPPLFDRLVGGNLALLDEEGLRCSVQKEIGLMLAARSSIRPLQQLEQPHETSLPFFAVYPEEDSDREDTEQGAFLDPQNQALWHQMELYFERCIQAFEPRLKEPQVQIEQFDVSTQSLCLTIRGRLLMGEGAEIFSFPLALNASDRFSL